MTLRANGGYIGPRDSAVSTTAASGVWDLRTAQRYQAEAAWPLLFVPDDISGLQLWLDASDASTLYDATTGGALVAADGGVARWEDKSGNNRHATQGTAANRPLRKTSQQNGLDTLSFDGSNDQLVIPSSKTYFRFLHYGAATAFVVVRPGTTADPDAAYIIFETGNLSTSFSVPGGYSMFYDDRVSGSRNDNLRIFIASGETGGSVTVEANDTVAANTYGVLSVVSDTLAATASRIFARTNGGSVHSTNTETGTADDVDAQNDLAIGARTSDLLFPLDGNIAEMIMYDSALSDTDRESVENYLMTKWGITP